MKSIFWIAIGATAVLLAGCSASTPDLSAADKASFSGKPMTNDQRNAMNASIEEYRRTHTSFPPKPDEQPNSGAAKGSDSHGPAGGG